jgi:hypothetical protein
VFVVSVGVVIVVVVLSREDRVRVGTRGFEGSEFHAIRAIVV